MIFAPPRPLLGLAALGVGLLGSAVHGIRGQTTKNRRSRVARIPAATTTLQSTRPRCGLRPAMAPS